MDCLALCPTTPEPGCPRTRADHALRSFPDTGGSVPCLTRKLDSPLPIRAYRFVYISKPSLSYLVITGEDGQCRRHPADCVTGVRRLLRSGVYIHEVISFSCKFSLANQNKVHVSEPTKEAFTSYRSFLSPEVSDSFIGGRCFALM